MRYLIIDNNLDRVQFYEREGVDTIFVDLERLGKQERQEHVDSVKSEHTIADVRAVRQVISKAELLVRIDPMNENSAQQIEDVIEAGADIIMLPYFFTTKEVKDFIDYVGARVKTCLLLETAAAVVRLPSILQLKGIDRVHIGLNDLALSLKLNFMFEILTTKYIDHIIEQLVLKGIPYGIGGVAPVYEGLIPGEMVLMEYYRLGASSTILSRPFSKKAMKSLDEFNVAYANLKNVEKMIQKSSTDEMLENKRGIAEIIKNHF